MSENEQHISRRQEQRRGMGSALLLLIASIFGVSSVVYAVGGFKDVEFMQKAGEMVWGSGDIFPGMSLWEIARNEEWNRLQIETPIATSELMMSMDKVRPDYVMMIERDNKVFFWEGVDMNGDEFSVIFPSLSHLEEGDQVYFGPAEDAVTVTIGLNRDIQRGTISEYTHIRGWKIDGNYRFSVDTVSNENEDESTMFQFDTQERKWYEQVFENSNYSWRLIESWEEEPEIDLPVKNIPVSSESTIQEEQVDNLKIFLPIVLR